MNVVLSISRISICLWACLIIAPVYARDNSDLNENIGFRHPYGISSPKALDYTPSNSYMTFEDGLGTPVQYTLSMTFQELEPVFEDEYTGHDIGY